MALRSIVLGVVCQFTWVHHFTYIEYSRTDTRMSKSIEAARAGPNASAVLRLTEVLCFLSLLHDSEVGIFTVGQPLEDSVA